MSPRVLCVLQTRMTSSRLPGKALLTIQGLPMFALAALRGGNTGRDVVVATSDDVSDDELAKQSQDLGLHVVRGSLNNVIHRFLLASRDMRPDDILVRLTADNVFPDGQLIDELLTTFLLRDPIILGIDVSSGLPYGISVEAFRVGALRQCAETDLLPDDLEHVTSPLWRIGGRECKYFLRHEFPATAGLRCTVDTQEDFLRVAEAFDSFSDPVNVSWKVLVSKLVEQEHARCAFTVGPRFQLGTAQLGQLYGYGNTNEQPSKQEAIHMVRHAVSSGASIDTARDYGLAEELIGQALGRGVINRAKVTTKLSSLGHLTPESSAKEVVAAVDASVHESLSRLGTQSKPNLLLHRVHHVGEWRGIVWQRLLELQQEEVLGQLGVSIYTPEDLDHILTVPSIEIIQLPANILDFRWRDPKAIARLDYFSDATLIGRSVFLQGILLRPRSARPDLPGLDSKLLMEDLRKLTVALSRSSVADLLIAYSRSGRTGCPRLDTLVIGALSARQLHETLTLFSRSPLSPDEADYCDQIVGNRGAALVDPRTW